MAIVINGDGSISGISAGGLPTGSVTADTLATNSVDSAELIDGAVDNSHLATGIDATKLADGTITNSELQYINSLSSNAQTQISAAGGVTTKTIHATYDLSTASGTQDVTGFGFTPSAIFGMFLINVTDDWCFGFSDFTMNLGMHSTSTTTAVLQGTYGFTIFQTTNSTTRQTANPIAGITDGVRLTWTKTGSPTGRGQLYLLGFQ